MTARPDPPFLERAGYRRRRLGDAGRLLPILGAILFAMPAIPAKAAPASTGRMGIYLFGVWAMLILAALLLSRHLLRASDEEGPLPDDTP